jgi:hypothetical protein
VTPNHPVFDASIQAFRPVRDLIPGRVVLLRLSNGAVVEDDTLTGIDAEESAVPEFQVFNLEAEGPEHNYFANGILVHNKLSCGSNCDTGTSSGSAASAATGDLFDGGLGGHAGGSGGEAGTGAQGGNGGDGAGGKGGEPGSGGQGGEAGADGG